MGLYLPEQLADIPVLFAAQLAAEAQHRIAQALFNDLFNAVKCAAANEQDIGGIDLQKLLLGMLPAALRRYICHGAFDDLQERLLNALAADVACNRAVLGLT